MIACVIELVIFHELKMIRFQQLYRDRSFISAMLRYMVDVFE